MTLHVSIYPHGHMIPTNGNKLRRKDMSTSFDMVKLLVMNTLSGLADLPNTKKIKEAAVDFKVSSYFRKILLFPGIIIGNARTYVNTTCFALRISWSSGISGVLVFQVPVRFCAFQVLVFHPTLAHDDSKECRPGRDLVGPVPVMREGSLVPSDGRPVIWVRCEGSTD